MSARNQEVYAWADVPIGGEGAVSWVGGMRVAEYLELYYACDTKRRKRNCMPQAIQVLLAPYLSEIKNIRRTSSKRCIIWNLCKGRYRFEKG